MSAITKTYYPAIVKPPEVPNLTGLSLNDLGSAERLELLCGADLQYVAPWKKWLIWDGSRWEPDETGEADRRVMGLSRELQRQAASLSDSERGSETKWALGLGEAKRVNSTLAIAGKLEGIATHPRNLDRDPFLLGVENGTIELKIGKFRESRREDLITKRAGASYDSSASCPIWENFLHTITGGDKDLIRFLQQAVGYSLTGATTEQCLFFLYGLGRNGKSTLVEILAYLLHDYAQGAPESLFAKNHRGGDQTTHDMAALCGARFAYGIELEEGSAMAESKIKRLTGGDSITARKIYGHWFTFDPTHTLWISGNHKPRIKGTDLGIWRRIQLVPFNVQIPKEVVDKTLPEQLRGELPGILNWAIAGCLDWQEHGLITPAVVDKATEDYRSEEDILGEFLSVHTKPAGGHRLLKSALFERYTQWAQDDGQKYLLTKIRLTSRLKERGIQSQRSSGKDYWIGLDLVDEQEESQSARVQDEPCFP